MVATIMLTNSTALLAPLILTSCINIEVHFVHIICSHSNGRRGSRQLAVKDFGVIKEDAEQAEVSGGPFEVFKPSFNQYQPS